MTSIGTQPTRVVNIRFDGYDVYCGRPGKGHDGTFGNPIVKGETCSVCGAVHAEAASTIPCFKVYFTRRVTTDGVYRAAVRGLRGKALGCFCAPPGGFLGTDTRQWCHVQIIAAWVDADAADVPYSPAGAPT